jgi:hypothetical protein
MEPENTIQPDVIAALHAHTAKNAPDYIPLAIEHERDYMDVAYTCARVEADRSLTLLRVSGGYPSATLHLSADALSVLIGALRQRGMA